MKTWLANLLGGGLIKLGEGVAGIADRFIQTPDEKAQFMLEVEKLLQQQGSELEQTIRAELQLKERVMVAELQSGDSYTRRARPTLAYFGMVAIAWNYVLIPTLWPLIRFWAGDGLPDLTEMRLPEEFWWAWAGVTGVWSVGRTMERRGAQNELVNIITGPQKRPSLLDN